MICKFKHKSDVIEIIPLRLQENDFSDDYTLTVVGLDTDGNYTNSGELILTTQEADELTEQHYIDDVKQLIGRKIMIVSNGLCKKAGIQHLNPVLTLEEWQILQPYLEKNNHILNNIYESEEIFYEEKEK